GNTDRAMRILRSAQQRFPTDVLLNLELAARLDQAKPPKSEQAIGFARAAVALRPESASVHARLGQMLGAAGHLDESIAAFLVAVRLRPDDASAHFTLGNLYQRTENREDAIRSMSKAIELMPGRAEYHSARGTVYTQIGQWELAADDYRRTKPAPFRPEKWLSFAGVYVLAGKLEEHRELTDSVIERMQSGRLIPLASVVPPGGRSRNSYLAARTVSLGPCTPATSTEAIRLAEEALDLDRKCAWNFHALGMARYRANQFDEAIKAIQASLDADPNWEGVACNWLVMAMA